ncbi:MAG: GNAT family N-acetyltransferase [Vicinamibacterales bacterium]
MRHEPLLRTTRLRLRPLVAEDAAAVHAALADPEVMAFWSSGEHRTLAATEAWLAAAVGRAEAKQAYEWAIEHRGEVVGRVAFHEPPWLGYFLAKSAWGKGLAVEALDIACHHAQAVLGFPVIQADVDPRNDRSLGVLARLGFEETARLRATWRVSGRWQDSVLLARPSPTAAATLAILPATRASDVAVARGLLGDYASSLGRDLSFQDFEAEHRDLPGAYAAPGGILLVAWRLGTPLGMVACRAREGGRAEMKRLYVRPEARGQGLGRALVDAVLAAAREAGHREMVLDTLPEMRGAQALYEEAGFVPIAPYYDTPITGTRFLGKAIG